MNKYLLLRDNKQTGPYTLDDLIEKGLKPYDLVWLEGRSAAWRYPSEFDELKPYSPEVEEQPFDRFYKKPAEQVNTVQEQQSVQQPVEKKVETTTSTNTKHIYVTMPNGNKAQVAAKQQETKKVEKPQEKKVVPPVTNKSSYLISEEDDELNSALLKGHKNRKKEDDDTNNGFLNDYEARKAAWETKKSTPVVAEEATTVQKKAEPVVETKKKDPIKEKEKEKEKAAFTPSYTKKKELKDLFHIPSHFSGNFFQDNKTLTRSLLAAVLILGGVVIGLIINSGKHKSDAQVLETLVKEIREQQKDKPATTAPQTTTPSNTHKPADQNDDAANDINNYTENNQPNNNNIGSEPVTRHVANKKEANPNANKNMSVPASNTSTEVVEPQPAVIDTKEKINQETLEKARKNIYDLVGVEASQYKVGLLGGISDLDITISNNSLYALDQVAVEIKYFGPEKRLVKSQTLVFNHVPAGKQRTLEAPRTSRGISIDYSITGINSKALGMAQAGY